MELTDRILLYYIKAHHEVEDTAFIGMSGPLKGVLMYERGMPVEPGWAYIFGCDDPVLSVPETLRIWIGRPGAALPDSGGHIILEETDSAREVNNELTRVFRMYEEWEQNLLRIQITDANIEEMLRVSQPVVQNPLMIVRSNLSMIAHASREPLSDGQRIFEPGRENMEVINAMLQDATFRSNQQSGLVYWGPDYITGYRFLNYNLAGKLAASGILMLLERDRPLDEHDIDVLAILGPYVHRAMLTQEPRRSDQEDSLHKLMVRILSDRTLDYMEASRRLSELGWMKQHEYLCLVFQITYLDEQNMPTLSVCNHLEEQLRHCCSFPYREDIVTFINLTLTGKPAEQVMTELTTFIRDSYLKAGYSLVMTGHMNLRRQYIQATLALDVGSRRDPYFWIHHFDEIAMTYILEQITRKLPGSMLCHQGLIRLQESDRDHGTEYMKTLRTYLDTQMNAVRSAKLLFIHRSTFLYRMEKIREIMESDLTDPEEILYIALSFRLLEREN